jgi:hypothetical protein
MSEAVDRAARAICVACDGCDPDDVNGGAHPGGLWLDEGEPWWIGYREHARAAIEALREPDEAMIRAMQPQGLSPYEFEIAIRAWRSMIDAALRD